MPLCADSARFWCLLAPTRLEAGGAPEGQPALEVLLHREVTGQRVAELDLQQVVAGLRAGGGEGVEGALLVEVDQAHVAPRGVVEGDQRAEQAGGEALLLERRVDGVEVG